MGPKWPRRNAITKKINNFNSFDNIYEPPAPPNLRLNTDVRSPQTTGEQVLVALQAEAFVLKDVFEISVTSTK